MAIARHRYNPRPRAKALVGNISYTGMRDSSDPTTSSPRKARLLRNVYPVDAEIGGGTRGREGTREIGDLEGRTQLIYHFSRLDGQEFTLAIAGGSLFQFNWSTETWSEPITGSTFTSAGVDIDSSARVYAVTFADRVVFSDGVNKPWTWDGTADDGVELLSNAPVAFGRPTVYYAKLFFIKDDERTAIVWSEENQPNTGYEAGGFNNAWTLGQTTQERLQAIYGTNEALYYWRDASIGLIAGAVTPEFRSTGTHEAISTTIGTRSPGSIILHKGSLFFMDQEWRPQRLFVGGGFQTPGPWMDARETLRRLSTSKLPDVQSVYKPIENMVLFSTARTTTDENSRVLAFNADSGEFVGVWDGATWELVEMASVKDLDLNTVLFHGNVLGEIFIHGRPDSPILNDEGEPIIHEVHGSPMMWDPRMEKYFTRMDFTFRFESSMTEMGITYVVPGCPATPLTGDVFSGAGGAVAFWDVAKWDEDTWPPLDLEGRLVVGISCRGRWIEPRIRHDTLDEQFMLTSITVEAYPLSAGPEAP